MDQYLKVQGHESLYRDTSSGAIINRSETDYKRFLKQKELHLARSQEIKRQGEEINNLKQDLAEIKSLLQKILEK